MRIGALAAIGGAAYVVFLLALTPASYVAGEIARATRGGFQLTNASGTIWRGEGSATLATPAGPLAVDRIAWRFQPAALVRGAISFAVSGRSAGFSGAASLGRSMSAWEARDVQAQADAAAAAAFLPLLAHWRPAGSLAVFAPSVAWDDAALRGEARIEWRDAALALSDVRPLGSYRLELRGDGGPAKVTLSTTSGPLQVSGNGTFTPPSRLQVAGEARAEGPQAASVQPLLDLVGPRRPDGSRAFTLRTP